MNKVAIAAAAAALLLPTVAAAEPTPHESCAEVTRLAEGIMEFRQDGVPMSVLMESAETVSEWRGLTEALIIDAYGQPRYSTAEFQQNAIRDFTNYVYRECIIELR